MFALAYPWTVYPGLLYLVRRLRPRSWKSGPYEPSVSILMTAHNAECELETKIRNCMELNYPKEKLQIVVVSDGSTDGTNSRLAQRGANITFKCLAERVGKNNALNEGIPLCTSELVFFTDVGALFAPESLKRLSAHFLDPEIGCVSSVITTHPAEGSKSQDWKSADGESLNFDLKLRRWESEVSSTVNVVGAGFMVRKALVRNFRSHHNNDFSCALHVLQSGHRTVLDPSVKAQMFLSKSARGELKRKIRTAVRGMWTLAQNGSWNILSDPFLFWQILSRKVAKWIFGYLYLGTVFLGFLNLNSKTGIEPIASGLLLAVLVVGAGATVIPQLTRFKFFRVSSFLWLGVEASLISVAFFLFGKKYSVWAPTIRIEDAELEAIENKRRA
ncbi:MAG: glycosyltransferase [Bdellovibrionales bacterium]|nr:glycosyltransferase [Bdellovibrionales bacterium]